MKPKTFPVGSKVKLTDKFLHNTGQIIGYACMDRWIVQDCPCIQCTRGDWICTDELVTHDYFTPEEVAAEPHLAFRHIAAANLQSA